VLIDCGVSARQVLTRMESVGLRDAPVNAVLLTHEHGDHVAGARVLCRRLAVRAGRPVPFFMTQGTRAGLRPKVTPDAIETIEPGTEFALKHLRVDPFPVPHDSREPVGYRVRSGGVWVGVITDLGRPTALVASKLATLTVASLEFNHDPELLRLGDYPWPLKQRIRSGHGHLSNTQAAALLNRGIGEPLRHLLLAHLSQKNNRPELALEAARAVLADHGVEANQVSVQVNRQAHPSPPVEIAARDW